MRKIFNKLKCKSLSRTLSFIAKSISLILILMWTLFPIYWMISLSFRNDNELHNIPGLIPKTFTYDHFITLFTESGFGQSIINSSRITFISLLVSFVLGIPCAYILAKRNWNFKYRRQTLLLVLLIRVLPPITFAIPLYTMMTKLGIMNTDFPLLIAHVLLNIPLVIWFLISFFADLPDDIEESARIDGASEFLIFRKIEIPLIAPGIAAASMLSLMASWNEYLYGVIFVQSPNKFTIPLILSTMNSEQELAEWGNLAAGGIVSMLPVLIFVIWAQNYLIAGLSNGAVKE